MWPSGSGTWSWITVSNLGRFGHHLLDTPSVFLCKDIQLTSWNQSAFYCTQNQSGIDNAKLTNPYEMEWKPPECLSEHDKVFNLISIISIKMTMDCLWKLDLPQMPNLVNLYHCGLHGISQEFQKLFWYLYMWCEACTQKNKWHQNGALGPPFGRP